MALDVLIMNPLVTMFEGKAESVVLPGEQGVFEVLAYHKPALSRLVSGVIVVDAQSFSIHRGIAKVHKNKVTAIVEES